MIGRLGHTRGRYRNIGIRLPVHEWHDPGRETCNIRCHRRGGGGSERRWRRPHNRIMLISTATAQFLVKSNYLRFIAQLSKRATEPDTEKHSACRYNYYIKCQRLYIRTMIL